MSGPTHGARTSEVEQIAGTLHTCAESLHQANLEASHVVQTLARAWEGADAVAYTRAWQSQGPALAAGEDHLRTMSSRLLRQVAEQHSTSAAGSAAGSAAAGATAAGAGATAAAADPGGPSPAGGMQGLAAPSSGDQAAPIDWTAVIADSDVDPGGRTFTSEEVVQAYGAATAEHLEGIVANRVEDDLAEHGGRALTAMTFSEYPVGGVPGENPVAPDGSVMVDVATNGTGREDLLIAEVVREGHRGDAEEVLAAAEAAAVGSPVSGEPIRVGTIGPDGQPMLVNPQFMANGEGSFPTDGVVPLGDQFPGLYAAYELTTPGVYEYTIYHESGSLPDPDSVVDGLTFSEQLSIYPTLGRSRPTFENSIAEQDVMNDLGPSPIEQW